MTRHLGLDYIPSRMRRIVLAGLAALVLLPRVSRAQAPAPTPAPGPTPGPVPAPPPDPNAIVPPQLLEQVEAVYPSEAAAQGLEATVRLELTLSATGEITDVKVQTPVGNGFDEAAVAAVRQFKFAPATKAGKPIAIRIVYEYSFKLEQKVVEVKSTRGALKGRILDEAGAPVSGVTIDVVSPEGTPIGAAVTGDDGGFEVPDLPPGVVTVELTPPEGFVASQIDEKITEGEEITVEYRLARQTSIGATEDDDYTTTVRTRPRREEVARKTITLQEIVRIPGVQGDAVRAVENFPGVARPPFNNGQIIIRGSAPEDSAVYLHGFWVPLVYHFGGLTSIINSDILSKVDFLAGNYSGRYGRATGGIIDIATRAPKRKWTGYVEADFIDANFLVEGPVGKGSLALAARRSYVDAYLGLILPEDAGFDFTSAPVYYDYQALYNHPKVAGGDLTVLFFGSDDRLRLLFDDPAEVDPAVKGAISNHIGFIRTHAIWNRKLSKRTDLSLAAGLGIAQFDFSLGGAFDFNLDAVFTGLRAEVTHRFDPIAKGTFGYEHQFVPYNIFVKAPRPPQEGEFPAQPLTGQDILVTEQDTYDFTPAIYGELELKVGKTLTLFPSSRLEYMRFGDQVTMSPRVNGRWEASKQSLIKGGVGLFTQPTQPWENDVNFGNPLVRGEQALHVTVGLEQKLPAHWSVDTSFFYKYLWDTLVRSNVLTLRDGKLTQEGYNNEGVGRIYGGELLIRRELTKNFFAWISYTLSRSERKDRPGEDYRLFDFDQTHIVTLVASRKWGKGWQLGARWRYVSGNPQTPAIGAIYDADGDVYIPIPGRSNSERAGAFHQLDVRLDKEFKFRTWALSLYLDVQNAYSRLNPEGYFYNYDYSKRSQVSGLPIIPSLGLRGEF